MSDEIKIIGKSSHPEEIEQAVKHLAELCKQYNCANILLVAPCNDNWNDPGIVAVAGSGKGLDFCMLAFSERVKANMVRSQMMGSN